MKKMLSVLLAIMMMFSVGTTAFAADFTDTADSNYYEAIETLHALKLVDGYDGKTYGPNDELTRAQACAIIIKAVSGEPHDYYNQIFNDVPVTHWAADYIAEAYNRGYMSGYGNNMFGPDDKVTYDQVSKIILNVLGYRNTGSWPEGLRETAKKAGLYENCVIVDPASNSTRGAVAQMIYNAFDCMTLNSNGFPTGETFLDSLGFEIAEPTWQIVDDEFTGHKVVTYTNGKKLIPTSVITTTAKAGKYISDTEVKIGSKIYTIDWANTELFVDGEDSNTYPVNIEDVTVIFEGSGKKAVIIAVVTDTPLEVHTFSAGAAVPSEVTKMKDYQFGISTVTQIGDEYKISNDTYMGYVVDEWTTNSYYCAEFSDGTVLKLKLADYTGWDFDENSYVIVFYDYTGAAYSFKQC